MRTSRLIPVLAALVIAASACSTMQSGANSAGLAFHEGHDHEIRDPWMSGDSVPLYRPSPRSNTAAEDVIGFVAAGIAEQLADCNAILCWRW